MPTEHFEDGDEDYNEEVEEEFEEEDSEDDYEEDDDDYEGSRDYDDIDDDEWDDALDEDDDEDDEDEEDEDDVDDIDGMLDDILDRINEEEDEEDDEDAIDEEDEDAIDEEDELDPLDERILDIGLGIEEVQDYEKAAKEQDKAIDPKFLSDALRNNYDLDKLSANSVFSYADLIDSFMVLSDLRDGSRQLVPEDNDHEGWAQFRAMRQGIPDSAADYPDDIFHGITIIETEEEKEAFRQMAHARDLSIEQARGHLMDEQDDYENQREENQKEYNRYIARNTAILRDAYGQDYTYKMSSLKDMIRQIPEAMAFVNEFKGTTAVNSANFFNMLDAIKNANVNLKEREPTKRNIETFGDDALLEKLEEVLSNPDYSESRANGSRAQKRKYEALNKRAQKITGELDRRGIKW